MHKITTGNGDFLFVGVPEDVKPETINTRTTGYLHYRTESCSSTWSHVTLPPGSYPLIADTATITEEQAGMIVELETGIMCAWYTDYDNGPVGFFGYALESFASLLRSNQLTGRYAILKIT